jgi:DNA polymerase-3 subunit delta'
MTAENAYDLLPTIRSRAVPFQFTPLPDEEMAAFARAKGLDDARKRIALAGGSPGVAASIDVEAYERRRAVMMTLLKVSGGATPFATWIPQSETMARSKGERLETHLKILYDLLRDIVVLRTSGGKIRNEDLRRELKEIADKVSFDWIRTAVKRVDEIAELIRRNIQKTIALDALILELRARV